MDDYVVLGTGSRSVTRRHLVTMELTGCLTKAQSLGRRLVVRHGMCPDGADMLMHSWATTMRDRGWNVVPEPHPAQNHPTEDFGPWPGAGPRRNTHMVNLGADEALAFIDLCSSPRCRRVDPHGSHGATDCANKAHKAGITVKAYHLWLNS